MSNGWQLELSKWGGGETRLVFWDFLHGEDRVFILRSDGTAHLHVEWDTQTNIDENIEITTEVNLPMALISLLNELNSRPEGQ